MSILRLARILWIGLRFRLYRFLPQFSKGTDTDRAVRLREALETLGPIFVKFGQILSTRRDLLPADLADELAKLQDRVPPFDPDLAIAEIEKSLGKNIQGSFKTFERNPVASASVAQVHIAVLKDGTEVKGRPIDCAQAPDGSILISDDMANKVYRLRYVGR